MPAVSNRPIEVAMTHRPGTGGVAERFARPDAIGAIAERLRAWRQAPETCQSCHALPAMSLSGGLPLCGRCREHRAERLGFASGAFGLSPAAVRAEGDDTTTPRLEGYAIVFNKRSVELWGFFEIIRPAAADRMVSEKPDLRALWNHNSDVTIGRVSAGTLRFVKRTRGVWVEIEPPKWAAPQVESVGRRDITGMSFAFQALEDEWHLEDGIPIREVLDMHVFEVSGVSFPAYPDTTLNVVDVGARSSWAREQLTAERLRLAR